ncbi:unnamed protein product [Dracunculus medinensis]|uniref:CX domain-containing protein n=1 Tax=Dracunculus medinensis TaxID=318479 RepID=A0A0N4U8U6_DRAME|nr:unnamed protein product [Dracunculus medinensis]
MTYKILSFALNKNQKRGDKERFSYPSGKKCLGGGGGGCGCGCPQTGCHQAAPEPKGGYAVPPALPPVTGGGGGYAKGPAGGYAGPQYGGGGGGAQIHRRRNQLFGLIISTNTATAVLRKHQYFSHYDQRQYKWIRLSLDLFLEILFMLMMLVGCSYACLSTQCCPAPPCGSTPHCGGGGGKYIVASGGGYAAPPPVGYAARGYATG